MQSGVRSPPEVKILRNSREGEIGSDAVNMDRLGGISGKLYELGTGNGKSRIDVRGGEAAGSELVSIIEEALDRISILRGRLGALENNGIETNISTLGVANRGAMSLFHTPLRRFSMKRLG